MNKLDILEEFLPDFGRFLTDLSTIKLTSDLQAKLNVYKQNIQRYLADHCSLPSSLPPPPPTENESDPKRTNGVDFIAKQRELARLTHTTVEESYYNFQIKHQTTDVEDGPDSVDNFYEPPKKILTPPVPTSKRPPIRIVDDQEAYEDPDDVPIHQVKSATLPAFFKQTNHEHEDSGGTMISFTSTSSSQPTEDYEMMPDNENYPYDDEDSWASTSYEDYDDEVIKQSSLDPDPKSKPKKDEKPKKDKLEIFERQHESESSIADRVGVLFNPGKGRTISKKTALHWDKRYCLARDGHLYCYKNPDSKKPVIDIFLAACEVNLVRQEGKHQYVFSTSHASRGGECFSAGSAEDANKWVEVLKGYTSMEDEVATTAETTEGQGVHTADEITKKVVGTLTNFFKRDKKGKDMSPQLSIDDKGILSGYINIMGSKYGEPKWRKKFLTIQDGKLTCYSEDGDTIQFSFPLSGTAMELAGQKEVKRKAAMKITKDSETLIFMEALNPLDMGHLLKKFMDEMATVDQKKDPATTKQRGMVSDILKAFEKQGTDTTDQDFYDDIQVAVKEDEPQPVVESQSVYQNFKVAFQQAGRTKKAPSSPRQPEEEQPSKDKDKKKTKEKKKSKDKKDKDKKETGKKKEEVKEEEPPQEERPKKRLSVKENKFEKSDKKHLLDVDRLQIERREVEDKKRLVTRKKIDLRAQKMQATDAKQKELLEGELKKHQQEWSDCSNRLAQIDGEIERLRDTVSSIEGKQDTAELARTGTSEAAKKDAVGLRSPGREVKSAAGNVQNKLKLFQEMNK